MTCHLQCLQGRILLLLEVIIYAHPLILMVVIAGSGSGKSTLIRLLYRFFEPSSGSIRIGGQDITAVDMESLRKAIAIVPQDSVLFHNTIRHNIAYGNLSASEDQIFRYYTVKTIVFNNLSEQQRSLFNVDCTGELSRSKSEQI